MPFCSKCGADVSGVTFCAQCGTPVGGQAAGGPGGGSAGYQARAAGGQIQSNVMGALAYVTIIPAILFLILEPYKNDPFVRFHSFQCIFLALTSFVLSIGLTIITMVPVVGWIFGIASPLVFLGVFVLWILAIFKAYQGEKYKLPIIGDFAEKQA
jgi:uncharacterized membrane protein